MRYWRSIPLAIGILGLAVVPASAGHGSGHAHSGHVHSGHVHAVQNGIFFRSTMTGNVLPSFASTNSLAALELHQRLVSNAFNSEFIRGFGTRGTGDLGLLSGGFGWGGGFDTYGAPAIPSAPQVVVLQQPPPPRPAAEAKMTVETTASGVEIVRGPGSRHVMHW